MTALFSRPEVPSEADQQHGENAQRPAGMAHATIRKVSRKKWIQFVVRAGITLLLFVFLLRSLSWATLFKMLAHMHPVALLMGLAVGMLCVVFSAYSWQSLLKGERMHLDLAKLINLYFIGMAFSHFLPTSMGGDAVKAFYVGREFDNAAGATSAVLLSRILGFVGMLLITIPILLIWSAHFTHAVIAAFFLFSFIILAILVGAMAFSACLPRLLIRYPQGKWRMHPIFTFMVEIGCTLGAAIRRPRSLSIALLFAMLFWISSFLNYYGYASALGMEVPFYGYVIAIAFSSLVAALPISINGFGVRESSFVYVFSMLHVAPTTSLLLAFLMDMQVLLFGAIGGCLYLTMGGKRLADLSTGGQSKGVLQHSPVHLEQ